PDQVWAVLRDFCGLWHPWMATIRAERDPRGALVRAFTVTGEDTLYREQLTYFSDSDRVLGYTIWRGSRAAKPMTPGSRCLRRPAAGRWSAGRRWSGRRRRASGRSARGRRRSTRPGSRRWPG